MAGTSEGAPISIAAAIAPMDSSAVMFHVPCRDHRVRNLPLFQSKPSSCYLECPRRGKAHSPATWHANAVSHTMTLSATLAGGPTPN